MQIDPIKMLKGPIDLPKGPIKMPKGPIEMPKGPPPCKRVFCQRVLPKGVTPSSEVKFMNLTP